ncbi:MAG: AAA family ATPase, partial [Desulfobacterales bacterium]|nr:AAA family ATPase [Desulfobacterales bacterium]
FELGDDIDKDFQLIHSLLDVDAIGEVFYTSRHSDRAVLLQAMRTGAKEFFSQPIKEQEVRQALEDFRERTEKAKQKEPVKIGQIIELLGSKGGVGTTTVAVNLAVSLSEMTGAHSVALIDRNMLFGEVPLFLEIKPSYHWGEITKNIDRLDSTFLMNVLSKHSSGVYVLPSPASLNGHDPATPEIMEHLLSLMQRMFDFVVIDGGQSLDETSLKILEMSDIVLLVSILSLPCLSNTKKLLKSFHTLGYPARERIKVIINRHLKNPEISLKDSEVAIDEKIFWTIPNDYRKTLSAINQGKPLSQLASRAPITKSVRELGYALSKSGEKQEKKGWRFLKRS